MHYTVIVVINRYAQAIKDFDDRLPELFSNLKEDDLVPYSRPW